MNILTICDSPEILSVFKLIKLALSFFRLIIPILLLVSLSVQIFQAIASSDSDMLKKVINGSVSKIIAAVIIFFIPTFLRIIVNLTSGDKLYETCLENATSENIQSLYVQKAEILMSKAEEKLSNVTYQNALSAIKKIDDLELRSQYEEQLESIKEALNAKKLIDIARTTKLTSDYEKAASAVSAIEDDELREELEEELEELAAAMLAYMSQYSSGGEYIENVLGLPRYDQCDSRWGSISYDTGGATFCSSSCGYTSFAMIAAGLNKNMSITPVTIVSRMRNISVSAGAKTSKGYGAASASELINYANSFGVSSKHIGVSIQAIQNELNSKKAVIALVPGHYIVLAPSGNSNTAVLLDPFSNWADARRKSGTYTLNYIFSVYGNPTWAGSFSK